MNKINEFTNKNIKQNIEEFSAIATFNINFLIQVIGYPSRYLLWNNIKYLGELVDENTKLDIDLLKLKEVSDPDWKNAGDSDKQIVIPKGTTVELYFNSDNYDFDNAQFEYIIIKYNGLEICVDNDYEFNDIIDTIDIL